MSKIFTGHSKSNSVLEQDTCLFICRLKTTGDDAQVFTTTEPRNKAIRPKEGYRNKCYSVPVNVWITISLCNSMLIKFLLFPQCYRLSEVWYLKQ